jgi:hypothetical protein
MEMYSCRWNAIRSSVMFSEQLLRYKFGGLERKKFVEDEVTTGSCADLESHSVNIG